MGCGCGQGGQVTLEFSVTTRDGQVFTTDPVTGLSLTNSDAKLLASKTGGVVRAVRKQV